MTNIDKIREVFGNDVVDIINGIIKDKQSLSFDKLIYLTTFINWLKDEYKEQGE